MFCIGAVDSNFEASWAPVHKMNMLLGLDFGYACVHIPGRDIASVQQTTRHVLPCFRVTFHHLVLRFEHTGCDLVSGNFFMIRLLHGEDWGVTGQWKVNAGVWNQVGLEFVQVDVQLSYKSKRMIDSEIL